MRMHGRWYCTAEVCWNRVEIPMLLVKDVFEREECFILAYMQWCYVVHIRSRKCCG